SGAHFSILAVIVLAATASVPRLARIAAVAVVMVAFVLLVRPEPSVLRAAAMGVVGLMAMLLRRPAQAIPALATAVVLLLVIDPWLAREYGFVLSVLATAGLVVLSGPVARRLSGPLPEWLAMAVAVPLAAQAVCGPVVVLLDPRVTLLAVPANLLAVPAVVPAT